MADTIKTLNDRPLMWTDPNGVTHAAEGCYISPPGDRSLLLWTQCGQHDIPANTAFHPGSGDAVDCPKCSS
mgnify:FL=1